MIRLRVAQNALNNCAQSTYEVLSLGYLISEPE